ncbi:hypothetical protein GCM10009639_19510 [Kitasatospora putterlickiae]|uniref:Uncharacterized protein n=1 Tax=Kitasatospora putterlickiae TaxID=221725 RepID=A0ABN1XUU8_9ACTN
MGLILRSAVRDGWTARQGDQAADVIGGHPELGRIVVNVRLGAPEQTAQTLSAHPRVRLAATTGPPPSALSAPSSPPPSAPRPDHHHRHHPGAGHRQTHRPHPPLLTPTALISVPPHHGPGPLLLRRRSRSWAAASTPSVPCVERDTGSRRDMSGGSGG